MKIKRNIIHFSKVATAAMLLVASIGFVEKKHHHKTVEEVKITIHDQEENFFVTEGDIIQLVNQGVPVVGTKASDHTLALIEKRLTGHDFIEAAEVYRDLKGSMMVEVWQTEPIARVLRHREPDAYISDQGTVLPTSEQFSARVLLVAGDYADSLIHDGEKIADEAEEVFRLITFINEDDFWRAQIAQLNIDQKGVITMYTQVGKQLIEFGTAADLESKFQRLDIFYKKILPKEGWNHYRRVNVEFKDQIVCE